MAQPGSGLRHPTSAREIGSERCVHEGGPDGRMAEIREERASSPPGAERAIFLRPGRRFRHSGDADERQGVDGGIDLGDALSRHGAGAPGRRRAVIPLRRSDPWEMRIVNIRSRSFPAQIVKSVGVVAIITVAVIQAETTLMADRSAETGLIEQVGGFIGDSANVDGDVVFSIGPKMHLASLDDDVLSISGTSPVLPAVVSDIEVVEDSIFVAMEGMGIARLEVVDDNLVVHDLLLDGEANYRIAGTSQAIYVAESRRGIKIIDRKGTSLEKATRRVDTEIDVRDVIVNDGLLYAFGIVEWSNTRVQSYVIQPDSSLVPLSSTTTEGSIRGEAAVHRNVLYFSLSPRQRFARIRLDDTTDLSLEIVEEFGGSALFPGATEETFFAFLWQGASDKLLAFDAEAGSIISEVPIDGLWRAAAATIVDGRIVVIDGGFGAQVFDIRDGTRISTGIELLADTELCEGLSGQIIVSDGSGRTWNGESRFDPFSMAADDTWRNTPSYLASKGDVMFAVSSVIDEYQLIGDRLVFGGTIEVASLSDEKIMSMTLDDQRLFVLSSQSSRSGAVRTLSEIDRASGMVRRSLIHPTISGGGNTKTDMALMNQFLIIADGMGGLLLIDTASTELEILDIVEDPSAVSNVVVRGNSIYASVGSSIRAYFVDDMNQLRFRSSFGFEGDIRDVAIDRSVLYVAYDFREGPASRITSGIVPIDISVEDRMTELEGRRTVTDRVHSIVVSEDAVVTCSTRAGMVVVKREGARDDSSVFLPVLQRGD